MWDRPRLTSPPWLELVAISPVFKFVQERLLTIKTPISACSTTPIGPLFVVRNEVALAASYFVRFGVTFDALVRTVPHSVTYDKFL